jgi:hypothetical protein
MKRSSVRTLLVRAQPNRAESTAVRLVKDRDKLSKLIATAATRRVAAISDDGFHIPTLQLKWM